VLLNFFFFFFFFVIRYFDEFLSGELKSDVFVNPYNVREAADIVHKLHLIAQELPYSTFAEVKSVVVCWLSLRTELLIILYF